MKEFLVSAFCVSALSAFAGWNGAGVSGGTGSANINDAANWTGGVINGDFSTITESGPTALKLTDNIAFAGGAVVTKTAAFGSGATDITLSSADGIAVGQVVSGTGIRYNTVLIGLSGNTATLSQTTSGASSGSYTFALPALNFNFGVFATRATNVAVNFDADVPGTTRTATLSGCVLQTQLTPPASPNAVTFSTNIAFSLTDQAIITREAGAIGSGTAQPRLTINGAFGLGSGGGSVRLQSTGGDLSLNGVVSGDAGIINGVALEAGKLALTNPDNSYSGGSDAAGFGSMLADATCVLANTGSNAALGSAGVIRLNNVALTLQGFNAPQITDRSWNVGGTSVTLGNSGTAPVMLTGPVVNNIASASLNLGGNYLNSGSPNVFSGVIANGTSSLGVFVWRGAWLLNNDASTFTGSVRVGGGGVGAEGATLQFSSLEDIGVASALGSGTEMVLGSAGGYVNYFEYVGTREVSGNRLLKIVSEVNGSGANVILANGLGTLDLSGVVTNAMTPNAAGVQTRTLYLGGLGSGRFSGQGGLADIVSGGNTARIGISKVGSGSWTFSGGNFNYQGLTDILAGNLILDYTSYDQFAAATPGNVRPDGGTLTFKGKPAGTTSDTLPALQIGRGDTNYRSSAIVLDANGGDGFHLTVNQLAGDTKTQKFDLIDLSGSAGNSITVGALGTSLAAVNGVLMNNNNRSVLVVRTPTQYGFAALSGGTSGTVQPLSGQTALPTSGYANNVNYILNTANTVTPTAEVNFSTLTVDTTAGASTIALGTQNLAPNGSGRGLLFCGPNDATLSGTGQRITTSSTISIFFQNYLDGNATLNVSAGIASTGYIQWGGTGFTLYTGTGLGQVFNLNGGIFRVATAQTVNFSNGAFVIANGGVFEIGADLNGAAAGDFSYPLGGAPAGANKLCIFGSSGFSAAGANRVVNFGGASAALTWGNNGFLTYAESAADYGYTFKLSSVKADATLEIQNPINLNGNSSYGRRRTVEVANGSAAVDAKLSGALSGNAAFVKTGAGTLELTGAQTYAGPLMVMDGMLRVGADDIFSGSITVQLRGGGLAMGSGANALGGLELYANSVIDVGSGSTSLAFADSSASVWSGTLTINGSLGPTSLRFGTDANGLTSAQIALISSCGMPVFLDASGYLCPVPGTVLVVR